MMNKSRGDYAYTLMDLDSPVTSETIEKIEQNQRSDPFQSDIAKIRTFRK